MQSVCRGEDIMKTFCECIKHHTRKDNYKKKKNKVINKLTAEIIWKGKNLPYI